MKELVLVVVLLLAGITGLGSHRGWFRLSTDRKDDRPGATITVDQDRLHEDEQRAKVKVQSLRQEAR